LTNEIFRSPPAAPPVLAPSLAVNRNRRANELFDIPGSDELGGDAPRASRAQAVRNPNSRGHLFPQLSVHWRRLAVASGERLASFAAARRNRWANLTGTRSRSVFLSPSLFFLS